MEKIGDKSENIHVWILFNFNFFIFFCVYYKVFFIILYFYIVSTFKIQIQLFLKFNIITNKLYNS